MQILPRTETKIDRVLDYFMAGGTLNFIEAQRRLHDRSLHSTVSALQNRHGINILRKDETVAGYRGMPTTCKRYSMELEERIRIARTKENIRKQKALNITDQDKERGLQMNRVDDADSSNKSQSGLNNGV